MVPFERVSSLNSHLNRLNSRQHIVNKAHIVESTINWNSIPMDGVTSNGIGTVNAVAGEGHVCILVNKQTTNDSELVIISFYYAFSILIITFSPITRLRHLPVEWSRIHNENPLLRSFIILVGLLG